MRDLESVPLIPAAPPPQHKPSVKQNGLEAAGQALRADRAFGSAALPVGRARGGGSVSTAQAQNILRLQRLYGNRHVQRLLSRQAESFEVVNGVLPHAADAVAAAAGSSGQPLPPELRQRFGQTLGANLDGVRVHTGRESAEANRAVSARAFALGQDIHFNDGEFNPGSSDGQRLLAHEVAHTVQQGNGSPVANRKLEVSEPGDALELEADRAAEHMMRDEPVSSEVSQTTGSEAAARTLRREVPPAGQAGPATTQQATATQQPPMTQSPAAPQQAAPANSRPSKAELLTFADLAINGEYASAARDGLVDFENDLGASSDFGPIATALAGNLIWAAACFTTGGAAFLISVGGIAIGTAAPAASGNIDKTAFHQRATDQIDGITKNLQDQVDRVTTDIDQQATAGNWDDSRTRRELLLRLLKPEYLSSAAGGRPVVDRAAIAHKIRIELLILANSYGPGIISAGGGQFIYDYTVDNHYDSHGFWPFSSTDLTPVAQWKFTRGLTRLYIPQGETSAHAAFTRIPLIEPADIPFMKTVYVHSSGESGDLIIHLDGQNNVTSVERFGIFEDLGVGPSHPRTPPSSDPVGAARAVVGAMWLGTGGRPAWVRGQDLLFESMPGRSRATR